MTLGRAAASRAHCLPVQLTPIDTPVYALHRTHGHPAGGNRGRGARLASHCPTADGGKLWNWTQPCFRRLFQEMGQQTLSTPSNIHTTPCSLFFGHWKTLWCWNCSNSMDTRGAFLSFLQAEMRRRALSKFWDGQLFWPVPTS